MYIFALHPTSLNVIERWISRFLIAKKVAVKCENNRRDKCKFSHCQSSSNHDHTCMEVVDEAHLSYSTYIYVSYHG